jgi:carbonic anhydrase/acetyltransferase-like protein (isoleucine patch superfamily)
MKARILAKPRIAPSAYVHPTAVIAGNVDIGKHVFVGPLAVIRADERGSKVTIGDNSNVQDGVIVHALSGTKVAIGAHTSLSHGVLVHGPCKIGNHCFIGFRTIVFHAVVAEGVYVGAAAVVQNVSIPKGCRVHAHSLVNRKGRILGLEKCGKAEDTFSKRIVATNMELVKVYKGTNG